MTDGPRLRDGEWSNWARTERARPARVACPSGDDEVARLVAAATRDGLRVKAVGAGHSWSDAACTSGVLVSLDRMRRLCAVDEESGDVTLEAGMRLHELNAALARAGRALPVLGSISEQSVAGATATGTHGSAPRLGNLASGIRGLRLVLADGSVRDVDRERDPSLFYSARVGLGAFGIVTRLTMRTVPAFDLVETREPMPFDAVLPRIEALVREEPFVKVWWLPHTSTAVVFRYRPTTAPRTFSERARAFDERVLNRHVLASLLSAGAAWPPVIPTINRAVSRVYFTPGETVGPSHRMLNLAMPPRHDELEYALPVARAADALAFVRDVIERGRLHVDFIVELRFSAADDAWLSPSYERDTCWIGAYIGQPRDRARYFDAVEEQCLAWGGRPHWGKRFSAPSDTLAARFPRWADAAAVRRHVDPTGTFEGPFLSRVFGRFPALSQFYWLTRTARHRRFSGTRADERCRSVRAAPFPRWPAAESPRTLARRSVDGGFIRAPSVLVAHHLRSSHVHARHHVHRFDRSRALLPHRGHHQGVDVRVDRLGRLGAPRRGGRGRRRAVRRRGAAPQPAHGLPDPGRASRRDACAARHL